MALELEKLERTRQKTGQGIRRRRELEENLKLIEQDITVLKLELNNQRR